jgi:hypothetical protein
MLRYRPNKDSLTDSQKCQSELLFDAAKKADLATMRLILRDDNVGIADFHYCLFPREVSSTTLTAFLSACLLQEYHGAEIGSKALEGTVLLVDHGANIMKAEHFKTNAVKNAVQRNMIEVAEYLITAVEDTSSIRWVNYVNSLIHVCVSAEMLQLLMRHGADITSRDSDGATILHRNNIDQDRQREIRVLALRCGVDVNAELTGGSTALHQAAIYGDLPSVRALCELGARLDGRDHLGNTPLETARVWCNQHWKIRDGREPTHTNFGGTFEFLYDEPLRRHTQALDYLSAVIEDPRGLGAGSTFSVLDRVTQESIMSMAGYVPDPRN